MVRTLNRFHYRTSPADMKALEVGATLKPRQPERRELDGVWLDEFATLCPEAVELLADRAKAAAPRDIANRPVEVERKPLNGRPLRETRVYWPQKDRQK